MGKMIEGLKEFLEDYWGYLKFLAELSIGVAIMALPIVVVVFAIIWIISHL